MTATWLSAIEWFENSKMKLIQEKYLIVSRFKHEKVRMLETKIIK